MRTKVCPGKLYCARVEWGKERIKEKEELIKSTGGIEAIYLDERKDFTTVNQLVKTSLVVCGENFNGKNGVSRMIKEDHCPILIHNKNLVKEIYLRTLILEKGKAKFLAKQTYDLLELLGYLETLIIFASDSCNKMLGHHGGTAACLEQLLARSLQRIYCFLHTCDLMGKRYFKLLDGKSSGPKSLKGPIGKRLGGDKLRTRGITDFKIIETTLQDLPPEVVKKLSQDYKYLYRGTKALAAGPEYFKENPEMATASPGPLFESRWLTLLNRCIRDYVSTPPEQVTNKQRKMVTFIAQVLAPAWFYAIAHPFFVVGPRALHKLVTDMAKFGRENFDGDVAVEKPKKRKNKAEDKGEGKEDGEEARKRTRKKMRKKTRRKSRKTKLRKSKTCNTLW